MTKQVRELVVLRPKRRELMPDGFNMWFAAALAALALGFPALGVETYLQLATMVPVVPETAM